MSGHVDVLAVLNACGAYVDDAAQFPEQFKPGVVKRHQRQYVDACAAVAELIAAAQWASRRAKDYGMPTVGLDAALARLSGAPQL